MKTRQNGLVRILCSTYFRSYFEAGYMQRDLDMRVGSLFLNWIFLK